MMDDDEELVFSKDCVVNLDDLEELEDYRQLIHQANTMLLCRKINEPLLARLFKAESDYLFQEEGIHQLIGQLLHNLNNYPNHRDNVLAMTFEFAESCLLSRQLEENGLMKVFLDTLEKHLTEAGRMLLLHFLNRMAWKIIYIDEEDRRSQLLGFFELLLRDNRQPTEKESYHLVEIIDVFLRHKWVRTTTRPLFERLKDSTNLGPVPKFFIGKYSHYLHH